MYTYYNCTYNQSECLQTNNSTRNCIYAIKANPASGSAVSPDQTCISHQLLLYIPISTFFFGNFFFN